MTSPDNPETHAPSMAFSEYSPHRGDNRETCSDSQYSEAAQKVETQARRFIQQREDRLAAVTLAKTIAFVLYSLLVPLVTLALMIFLPVQGLSKNLQSLLAGAIFVTLEYLIFRGVMRGFLPSPQAENVNPFNEHQMALGIALLSLTPWLLRFDPIRFQIFQVVINGSLCFAVFVFFITKSMLSRRFRWGVLLVGILPFVQLFFSFDERHVNSFFNAILNM